MGALLDRGRRRRMLPALQNVPDEDSALAAIGGEFDGPLAALYRRIWATTSVRAQSVQVHLGREDWLGARGHPAGRVAATPARMRKPGLFAGTDGVR